MKGPRDDQGRLVFYNEPAEKILGYRYEATGPMPALVVCPLPNLCRFLVKKARGIVLLLKKR